MSQKFISFITSSQTKIFPDSCEYESICSGVTFANEPYSFALAYKADKVRALPISVSVYSDAPISVYKVGYVPVVNSDMIYDEVASDNRGPGLYPDMLLRRSSTPNFTNDGDPNGTYYEEGEENLLCATGAFQSLLITFNEAGDVVSSGDHEINLEIRSCIDGSIIARHIFTVTVLPAQLPESSVMYTNWFYNDCIADIHGVELYSDRFFGILRKYFENAARHQMNTLLLPAFTPALDTYIGHERMRVQLVKIKKRGEEYEFDFSLLERYVKLAIDCKIKYFEHAHFFTQWGAKNAPNIYADVDGREVRIFGWDTDAGADEYAHFLEAYIPAFLAEAEKLGIKDKLFFHISDEPTPENKESYERALKVVAHLIKDCNSGDALSHIGLYENGFVKTPIVMIANADVFFGKCDDFWLYYTGGYYEGQNLENCTNRLITTKPYRTRALGLHMYKYKASGFLHWGYNYYYGCMSKGIVDPRLDPCGYKQMPGASYLVYPGCDDVIPSLREKYMCEAMCDMRALKLLESYIGYERVMALCEEFFGENISITTIPESAEKMLAFREKVNEEIKKRL